MWDKCRIQLREQDLDKCRVKSLEVDGSLAKFVHVRTFFGGELEQRTEL